MGKPADTQTSAALQLIDLLEAENDVELGRLLYTIRSISALQKIAQALNIENDEKDGFALRHAIYKEVRRLRHSPAARSNNVDVPCPVVNKPSDSDSKFLSYHLRHPQLTDQQLGIYAAVRDCIYPHPLGSRKDRKFMDAARMERWASLNTARTYDAMILWNLVGRNKDIRDVCLLDNRQKNMLFCLGRVEPHLRLNSPDELPILEHAFFSHLMRFIHTDKRSTTKILREKIEDDIHVAALPLVHIVSDGLAHLLPMTDEALYAGFYDIDFEHDRVYQLPKFVADCDIAKKPWLPILCGIQLANLAEGHAVLILLNRATGVAYFFDPNGNCDYDILKWKSREDVPTHSAAVNCLIMGIASSVAGYQLLRFEIDLPLDQWQRTRFISGPAVGAAGPQTLQQDYGPTIAGSHSTCQVWTYLFLHLFILNPQLDPEEVLSRMVDPAVRPFLHIIISRYAAHMVTLSASQTKAKKA